MESGTDTTNILLTVSLICFTAFIRLTDVINHLNASDPSLGRKEVTQMLYHLEEQELIQGIILKRVWPGRFMVSGLSV